MAWQSDYLTEQNRRISNLAWLNADARRAAGVMEFYRTHPIEWINDWCVTFDPRNTHPIPRVLPFRLFKRQEEFILFLCACLDDKESGLVEKSRDIGASWLSCAFAVWLWIFHPGSAIGWGSRKEEYVDCKGDLKALFPKMRLIMDNLPCWMMPIGFDKRLHSSYMKILNPQNGSTITGEAGDSIGRGGRSSIFLHDESAHAEHPELIEAALGDNTDVCIDISSVNGTGGVFYRRRMAGEVW
ncbi:MAG: hypothetical protein ACRD4H_04695, partial [Candidatus Acidiferrales bacterium]